MIRMFDLTAIVEYVGNERHRNFLKVSPHSTHVGDSSAEVGRATRILPGCGRQIY